MKKLTGRYTAEATKVLKNSNQIICHVADDNDPDGGIYVTNGFVVYRMTPPEYAAIVQPVAQCEAGSWKIDQNGKQPSTTDLAVMFTNAVKHAATSDTLRHAPMTWDANKTQAAVYYNASADFAALYNTSYVNSIHPAATLRAARAISPATACMDGEPFAIIMPIRPDPKAARAVKAYFTDTADETADAKPAAKLDNLRARLHESETEAANLREQLRRVTDELEALRAQAPAERESEPKTAAEIIAARWAEVDGLTATIKGAATNAPVVWLAGDTKPHEKQIEAAGGKWSGKKNAYYFRIA